MNIPEEFGKYLLLKKLAEDPLGETFRAGKVGKDAMEQVVLLRVFNGKGVDGEKLWQKASGRAALQQTLRSPNIGSGVDLGRVRSFPYAAYDYISGKNLAALLAQANRQMSPIPTDHALLIAERIALALAAAYETRLQDERILHGFVTPHLVMISSEGETRLLGFEVGPGLRALAAAGWQDSDVRPYVSPETFAGAAPSKADDVFSLGAVLFELLTGERLPAGSAETWNAHIDAAELPNEGTPMPAEIADLLKKSLAPREQRIQDAATWHKTLSKLMIDAHYSPTTFNLAFFMHNLFRDEIERESQEMQAEKKLELPKRPAAPAPVPAAAAAATREVTAVRQGTLPGGAASTPEASSKKPLWIGIAAAVVVAAGLGGYMMFGRKAEPAVSSPAPAVPAAQTAAMPGGPLGSQPAPAAVPAGPTPEELQAQIQAMIAAQSKDVEDKLKTQYDNRLKQLQQQLEESRKVQMDRSQPVDSRPVPPPVQVQETPAPAPERARPQPEPTPAPQQAQPERTAALPAPVQSVPAEQPAPTPAPARQVQAGDLVQAGPGVVLPRLSSRLDPRYPSAAQKLRRAAQVEIRVLVDERGRVLEAQRSGPKAGMGFDEAALDAARRATFTPATKEGVRVKMWTTIRVSFQP